MNKIKTGSGRALRTEALAETALPVSYDATAMPGASVLGNDGQVYTSIRDFPSSPYRWSKMKGETQGVFYLGEGAPATDIGSTQTARLQVETFVDVTPAPFSITAALIRHSNLATAPPALAFCKSRGSAAGSRTICQADDRLGSLLFQGADGVEFVSAAWIRGLVDGAPAVGNVPGRLDFFTRPAGGAETLRLRLNSAGNLLLGNTTGTEKLDVTGNIKASDSLIAGGRLTIGGVLRPVGPGSNGRTLHVEAGSEDTEGGVGAAFVKNFNDSTAGQVILAKTRGATPGGTASVIDGDSLGTFSFAGAGPSGGLSSIGAGIRARVSGAVSGNLFPVGLEFIARSSGSDSMEMMRLTNLGNLLLGNTTGTQRLSVTGNAQLTESTNSYMIGSDNVVGSRKTGWAAPIGTATRTAFDTATATATDVAERIKALIDDLTSHGLIGA